MAARKLTIAKKKNADFQFYATVRAVIPSIAQLISTGHSAPAAVFAALIGPVLFFILDFVWRFVTDPISHACWSGLSGYFTKDKIIEAAFNKGGTSGALLGTAALLAGLGVLGDLLYAQRVLTQRTLERARRIELALGVPPSDHENGSRNGHTTRR